MQRHGHPVLCCPESGCDLGNAVKVPVSADEHAALFGGEPGQEPIDGLQQLPAVDLLLHGVGIGHQLCELVQNGRGRSAAPLAGGVVFVPVEGYVPCELSQKGRQDARPVGRHGVPRLHIGVVDTFLGILRTAQDVSGDGGAVAPVFFSRGGDGLLVPIPVQPNDRCVIHSAFPPFCAVSVH